MLSIDIQYLVFYLNVLFFNYFQDMIFSFEHYGLFFTGFLLSSEKRCIYKG